MRCADANPCANQPRALLYTTRTSQPRPSQASVCPLGPISHVMAAMAPEGCPKPCVLVLGIGHVRSVSQTGNPVHTSRSVRRRASRSAIFAKKYRDSLYEPRRGNLYNSSTVYNLVYLITIHIVPGSYPSMDVNHADSFTFVSALGVSEPADAAADAGMGVGRENRDSCERKHDVRVD